MKKFFFYAPAGLPLSSHREGVEAVNTLRDTLRVVLLVLYLSFPVLVICFKMSAGVVQDPDVWWHLRTADWMGAKFAVPQFDPFSGPGQIGQSDFHGEGEFSKQTRSATVKSGTVFAEEGRPWVDYSWAAQLVLGGFYRVLGLRGLIAYTAIQVLLIVLAFHVLVRRMQKNLLLSAVLTLAAALGMLPLAMPRPWLFSMLFFVVELHLLLEAGRTARPRLLLLLVPLFWVWANVHIQVMLGLFVLAVAVVEPLLARRVPLVLDGESAAISARWLLLVFLLCCGVTLLNPYHVRLYAAAVQLLSQTELWNGISEMQAMPFRSLAEWVVLAAALAGAAALAARRPLRLLLVLLFPLAVYCSFRSRRDQWLVLIVGLSLVASMSRGLPLTPTRLAIRVRLTVAAILAALVLGSLWTLDEARLEGQVAQEFPARAVAFLRQRSYDGPLYNTYNWGGYLIFHYPEHPVSIDGRTLIHGSAHILHSIKMQRGEDGWQSDPELAAARLFILPRQAAITLLLRLDGRFQVVYEDNVAVVFVRLTRPLTYVTIQGCTTIAS